MEFELSSLSWKVAIVIFGTFQQYIGHFQNQWLQREQKLILVQTNVILWWYLEVFLNF